MSLAAGLAGVLGIISAAAAQPPVQLAMGGLGPTVSHEEMAERVDAGIFGFLATLAAINPTAGPATGTPVSGRNLAADVGKGSDGGLRYLCPDRLYKSSSFLSNHIYTECSDGTPDILPENDTPSLSFVKITPNSPPSFPVPPVGPPTPLPCNGAGFTLSMVSNMTNVQTVTNSGH
ncbi:MAG: hypothetical protein ACREEL_14335 [Stellaceae bacterium]